MPRFENPSLPGAGQFNLPKQLAGGFVEALANNIPIEIKSSLHSTFQLRVHGQEQSIAM
jgi:hypothetical protein